MRGWMPFAVLALSATASLGADKPPAWPQFRGPGGSGVAEQQSPPVEIGPDKNVKWKIAVPSGLSSPVIVGDKLVLTAFDDGALYTIAYNRADGKEAWRAKAPAEQIEAFYKPAGSPAASTPVTDGERIISYFGSCGLVCYDLQGKELWKYSVPVAVISGDFGTGASPTLADGLVVVVRDETKGSRVFAVDVRTGEKKWETKRQSPMSYCTPVVWDTPAGKQLVAAGHGRMVGYDLNSGKEKWFINGMPSGCCSSPVSADGTLFFAGWSPGGADDPEFQMPPFEVLLKDADADQDGALSKAESEKTFLKDFFESNDPDKDGKVTKAEWDALLKFMSEGKNSAFAVKPGGTGDITKSHVLWTKTKGLPYIATAILYKGQYVMVRDGGMLTALDEKSGSEVYVQKRVLPNGSYYASPVAAGGHIYFASLEDGTVTVIKAGAKEPEVVAKNPSLGESISATPAIADNTLYIRTAGHLYAFATQK